MKAAYQILALLILLFWIPPANGKETVSIVLPTYNSENFLADAINSVLVQSNKDWHLYIVDDGSTDKTLAIAKQYAKKYASITLIEFEENQGVSKARNAGLDAAQGRYIAFLDADDLWTADKLDRQLKFMKLNGYAFTFTSFRKSNLSGTAVSEPFPVPKMVTYCRTMKFCSIAAPTVMIDREQTGELAFNADLKVAEDVNLWLSLMKSGYNGYSVSEDLAFVRRNPESLSSNHLNMAFKRWRFIRDQQEKPLLTASYYFAHYAFGAVYKRAVLFRAVKKGACPTALLLQRRAREAR